MSHSLLNLADFVFPRTAVSVLSQQGNIRIKASRREILDAVHSSCHQQGPHGSYQRLSLKPKGSCTAVFFHLGGSHTRPSPLELMSVKRSHDAFCKTGSVKVGVITSLAHVITLGLLKFHQLFEVKSYFSPPKNTVVLHCPTE